MGKKVGIRIKSLLKNAENTSKDASSSSELMKNQRGGARSKVASAITHLSKSLPMLTTTNNDNNEETQEKAATVAGAQETEKEEGGEEESIIANYNYNYTGISNNYALTMLNENKDRIRRFEQAYNAIHQAHDDVINKPQDAVYNEISTKWAQEGGKRRWARDPNIISAVSIDGRVYDYYQRGPSMAVSRRNHNGGGGMLNNGTDEQDNHHIHHHDQAAYEYWLAHHHGSTNRRLGNPPNQPGEHVDEINLSSPLKQEVDLDQTTLQQDIQVAGGGAENSFSDRQLIRDQQRHSTIEENQHMMCTAHDNDEVNKRTRLHYQAAYEYWRSSNTNNDKSSARLIQPRSRQTKAVPNTAPGYDGALADNIGQTSPRRYNDMLLGGKEKSRSNNAATELTVETTMERLDSDDVDSGIIDTSLQSSQSNAPTAAKYELVQWKSRLSKGESPSQAAFQYWLANSQSNSRKSSQPKSNKCHGEHEKFMPNPNPVHEVADIAQGGGDDIILQSTKKLSDTGLTETTAKATELGSESDNVLNLDLMDTLHIEQSTADSLESELRRWKAKFNRDVSLPSPEDGAKVEKSSVSQQETVNYYSGGEFQQLEQNESFYSMTDQRNVAAAALVKESLAGRMFEGSIIDTDGTEISFNDEEYAAKMRSILLSPSLITRRYQQALNVIEGRSWNQLAYLLSANPWLMEMTDVRNDQTIVHALSLFGGGQSDIDLLPQQLAASILDYDSNVVHKLDVEGNLPLHFAAASGNVTMIEELGKRFKGAASVQNHNDLLPLHLAIMACALFPSSGKKAVAQILALFPGATRVRDNDGNTPIDIAESLGGVDGADIIHMLLEHSDNDVYRKYAQQGYA